jgi:hypothetical protein
LKAPRLEIEESDGNHRANLVRIATIGILKKRAEAEVTDIDNLEFVAVDMAGQTDDITHVGVFEHSEKHGKVS